MPSRSPNCLNGFPICQSAVCMKRIAQFFQFSAAHPRIARANDKTGHEPSGPWLRQHGLRASRQRICRYWRQSFWTPFDKENRVTLVPSDQSWCDTPTDDGSAASPVRRAAGPRRVEWPPNLSGPAPSRQTLGVRLFSLQNRACRRSGRSAKMRSQLSSRLPSTTPLNRRRLGLQVASTLDACPFQRARQDPLFAAAAPKNARAQRPGRPQISFPVLLRRPRSRKPGAWSTPSRSGFRRSGQAPGLLFQAVIPLGIEATAELARSTQSNGSGVCELEYLNGSLSKALNRWN